MRIAFYGMPCSGKTTVLSSLDFATYINGSSKLNEMTNGNFRLLSKEEQEKYRILYTEYFRSIQGDLIISDGHYSFLDEVVFTQSDGNLYDAFIYFYCSPETLKLRLEKSLKNEKYSNLSISKLKQWQDFEIENLRSECHKNNKDFYVINGETESINDISIFISAIQNGFSSFNLAKYYVGVIKNKFPNPCELLLVDGDKTIINEDSFRICTNNHVTKVFDGDFYTGYQSYKFNKEVSSLKFDYSLMKNITLNYSVYNKIKDSNYIVLSSGISEIWEKLCHIFGIKNHIADSLISADTKFFITKLLKLDGYKVKSFGDSMVDLYMLRNSDEGYLFLGNKMSRSLVNVNTSGLNLMYNKEHVILLNSNESFVKERVDICKSDSGISGNILAKAHYELGEYAGEYMKKILPNKDTGILILERGGRFFGDGFYINYGGTLYPYNPKKDELPKFKENNIIILDSVINSGKSLIELIESIKSFKSSINIFIVANVIQEKSLALFKDYKLVAIRSSSNSFVGATQVKQIAGKGPDTADRLFNLIK